jgi:hypothetical protein
MKDLASTKPPQSADTRGGSDAGAPHLSPYVSSTQFLYRWAQAEATKKLLFSEELERFFIRTQRFCSAGPQCPTPDFISLVAGH